MNIFFVVLCIVVLVVLVYFMGILMYSIWKDCNIVGKILMGVIVILLIISNLFENTWKIRRMIGLWTEYRTLDRLMLDKYGLGENLERRRQERRNNNATEEYENDTFPLFGSYEDYWKFCRNTDNTIDGEYVLLLPKGEYIIQNWEWEWKYDWEQIYTTFSIPVFKFIKEDTVSRNENGKLEVIAVNGEISPVHRCGKRFGCDGYSIYVEYPQIKGLSDTVFQSNINSVMKDYSLLYEERGVPTHTIFRILQNDGNLFAVKLIYFSVPDMRCGGGNASWDSDTTVVIDVIQNKIISDTIFSKGGNRIYPPSNIKMSVSKINQLIRNHYERDDCCREEVISQDYGFEYDHFIKSIEEGLFVITDGWVAIEQYRRCGWWKICFGINTIPLYKLE